MLSGLGGVLTKGRTPLHILNVSCSKSLEEIARYQTGSFNGNVTCSTATHYLFFSSEDVDDKATQFKCLPPIREKENYDALIQALIQNKIDIITSSHFATFPQLKNGCPNFLRAMPGVSTIGYDR
jgi:allantoinase